MDDFKTYASCGPIRGARYFLEDLWFEFATPWTDKLDVIRTALRHDAEGFDPVKEYLVEGFDLAESQEPIAFGDHMIRVFLTHYGSTYGDALWCRSDGSWEAETKARREDIYGHALAAWLERRGLLDRAYEEAERAGYV